MFASFRWRGRSGERLLLGPREIALLSPVRMTGEGP